MPTRSLTLAMLRLLVVAATLTAATVSLATVVKAADVDPFAVGFVLSCSKSMESAITTDGPSRFSVARTAVIDALAELTKLRGSKAGVWCYGHRLAWEEGDTPGIVDNGDYLAQTDGFQQIERLVPGDDAELFRAVGPVTEVDLAMMQPAFEQLKPFGEAPLFRAVTLAEESFSADADVPRGIILLTDGGLSAVRARQPADLETVLKACDKHRIPVHVVGIGLVEGHPNHRRLSELARLTDGSFATGSSSAEVRAAIVDAVVRVAQGNSQTMPVESAPVTARGGIVTVSRPVVPDESRGADPRLADDSPKFTRVTGVVAHAGKPIAKAKVTIAGVEAGEVKTDSEGRYVFEKVPTGKHTLVVEGIARNKIRRTEVTLSIEPPAPGRRTVDITLP